MLTGHTSSSDTSPIVHGGAQLHISNQKTARYEDRTTWSSLCACSAFVTVPLKRFCTKSNIHAPHRTHCIVEDYNSNRAFVTSDNRTNWLSSNIHFRSNIFQSNPILWTDFCSKHLRMFPQWTNHGQSFFTQQLFVGSNSLPLGRLPNSTLLCMCENFPFHLLSWYFGGSIFICFHMAVCWSFSFKFWRFSWTAPQHSSAAKSFN